MPLLADSAGNFLLPPAKGQPGKNSARTSSNRSSAGQSSEHEISQEIAALWRSPSSAFSATFAHLGEEPRDVSIDKLRKFLNSGQDGVFGINLGQSNSAEKQAASYALARMLTKNRSQPSADERKEALALFANAAGLACLRLPSLWHTAEIAAASGDEATNRATLNKIKDDSSAGDLDRARAQYELAQSYLRNPAEATSGQALLLDIREKYPSTEYAKGACYYLAQAAINEAGGTATPAAVSYLKEYLKWTTNGRFSSEVADKLWALGQPAADAAQTSTDAAAVTLSNSDLEQIASVFYKRGDLTRALAVYDRLGPDAKLLQRAQCYSKLGRKAEAVSTLLTAVKQDPTSTTYDDYAATICVPLTKAEATDLWRNILKLNPKHADHAIYNLATRVEETEALPLFARLLNQFPTSEHAPESLWWLFWHQAKAIYPSAVAKDPAKSLALIKLAQQGVTRYPQHRVAARLAFWAGKIYEKLGQTEEAKHEYELARDKWPTNYYGARARYRLHYLMAAQDKKHDRAFATSPNRQLSPDTWNWPQPPHLFSFDKVAPLVGSQAMVLAVTHQADECLSKIDTVPAAKAESGEQRLNIDCLRSWLYLSQCMPMEGIRAAARDLDGHPSKAPRWQINYPWAYAGQINEAARKNGVDPYLVHALIREESRYFPMALSRSNAIGLMQLLPGTAFGVAKRIGLPISSKDEIFIPDNNIKMGTAYLAYTLSRFDGQAMLAVASYNGGPHAVKHWVDVFHAKGGNDWDIFVENIPFRETRDYVRKVFGSYWTYELIYQ
ncbi:MAG: transglycosylase SLT domain-containing protein [Cyanobacteria bacterium SZAS LIN-2]|nr:transglycosylase SLT domain-containing protein [Cyanobacteria bacterium SZAS LIN-2]